MKKKEKKRKEKEKKNDSSKDQVWQTNKRYQISFIVLCKYYTVA